MATLIRRSNTLYYLHRSTYQTMQQALQFEDAITPLLWSRIYSEYACNLAQRGQEQDAKRYMGLPMISFQKDHSMILRTPTRIQASTFFTSIPCSSA